jgi:hypothetical protein
MSKVKNPTKLQSILAVASFIVGTIIGCISLFVVPPPGEITNSALGLTSEFLILSAAMLGVNVAFDYKLSKFKSNVKKSLEDNNIEYEEELPDE